MKSTNQQTIELKPAGSAHILAIGIDRYDFKPNLKSSKKGVNAFCKILQDKYGFLDGNIDKELFDELATDENINRSLNQYKEGGERELCNDDTLVFYFSGHGGYENKDDRAFIAPYNSSEDNDSNLIYFEDLERSFNSIQARHILFICDSCFSGGAVEGSVRYDNFLEEAYSKPSRQAITSGALEVTDDVGELGLSTFTYHLLKAFDQNDKPNFKTSELFKSLYRDVNKKTGQTPRCRNLKNCGGEPEGELVFFREQEEPSKTEIFLLANQTPFEKEVERPELEAEKPELARAFRAWFASMTGMLVVLASIAAIIFYPDEATNNLEQLEANQNSIVRDKKPNVVVSHADIPTVKKIERIAPKLISPGIYSGHTKPVSTVSYSPNNLLIASGSHDRTVKIWDSQTKELLETIDVEGRPAIQQVLFSRNGKLLAIRAINTVYLWDLSKAKITQKLIEKSIGTRDMVFSPDDKYRPFNIEMQRPFNIEMQHFAHIPLKRPHMGFCIRDIFLDVGSACLRRSELRLLSA